MLDVETYILTKHNPGGPIMQMKHLPADDFGGRPVSIGVAIGRVLGLAVLLALGIYASYAI